MYFSRKFYIYQVNWMNNADLRIYIERFPDVRLLMEKFGFFIFL